jgi:cytochrome c biogenesis protein CcmG/thiol:disulfide interchange protein DsbE
MKNIKYFLPLIIFIAIALFFWQGLKSDPHEIPSVLVGKPLPEFSAEALMSDEVMTQDIFKGQVSLLNVWATWCPTCYAEHSVLQEIADSNDITIFGLDYKDDKHKATKWLNINGNPYNAIIYDPQGVLAMQLGVYGTPETFVIDKQGIIRYKHIGAVSPSVWQDKLHPMVKRLSLE